MVVGIFNTIISILLLIVNVVVLTLVIVGIQKELRNLLVPALVWCLIYPIINFFIVLYSLVMFSWMIFVVSLLILVIQPYFWFALVSVYASMSSRIKVTLPLPEVKIDTKWYMYYIVLFSLQCGNLRGNAYVEAWWYFLWDVGSSVDHHHSDPTSHKKYHNNHHPVQISWYPM